MTDTPLWQDQVAVLQRLITIAVTEIEAEITPSEYGGPVSHITPTAAVAAGTAMAAAIAMAHIEGRLFPGGEE